MRIDEERLKPYRKMTDAQRNIRSAGDPEFTQQVLDHYMFGDVNTSKDRVLSGLSL